MKKWTIFVSLLIIIAAIPVVRNIDRYRMSIPAAVGAAIMDSTTWSPYFTDAKLRSIELGMNSNQVLHILGTPLVITTNDSDTLWHYTMGPNGKVQSSSDGSTHVRSVVFDQKMHVTECLKYFNFD